MTYIPSGSRITVEMLHKLKAHKRTMTRLYFYVPDLQINVLQIPFYLHLYEGHHVPINSIFDEVDV